MNKEKIESVINKIKNNKKLKIIIIALCVLLIMIVTFYDSIFQKTEPRVDSVNDYVNTLEKDLKEIISKIDGAGNVDVMISVECGNETVLASTVSKKISNGNTEIEETPILINGKTVVLKENYPKIQGVIIVCEGAKKIAVVNAIKNATTSLLNIENEKIQILKMK